MFREIDTGVVRLHASAHTGGLKGKPIWTAFITRQIRMPEWASRDSERVVHLAELEHFIFSDDYNPPTTSKDAFELTFITTRGISLVTLVVLVYMLTGPDAEEFMANIEDLKDTL